MISETSEESQDSVIEELTDKKSLAQVSAMKKRIRRSYQPVQAKTSLNTDRQAVLKTKAALLEEEMLKREKFSYENKRYIETVGANPVVVTANQNVKVLDMLPKVNILEDCQFRKALPKSFKVYQNVAPFSERLNRIKDN